MTEVERRGRSGEAHLPPGRPLAALGAFEDLSLVDSGGGGGAGAGTTGGLTALGVRAASFAAAFAWAAAWRAAAAASSLRCKPVGQTLRSSQRGQSGSPSTQVSCARS